MHGEKSLSYIQSLSYTVFCSDTKRLFDENFETGFLKRPVCLKLLGFEDTEYRKQYRYYKGRKDD